MASYPKPSEADLRRRLSPLEFEVTQHDATEPPFRNRFWNHHDAGIYVDVVTGEPLFSSHDKFDSGTGWPSFTRPIGEGHVVEKSDRTHGMARTEVRSRSGNSHLGHVFDDGPPPTGLRYCINSASLRFVPAGDLASSGYGAYADRFGAGAASPPPATDNACAVPPPGERPGCEATLDTAILAGGAEALSALRDLTGILEAEAHAVAGTPAVRVVFDPKTIDYEALLDRWSHLASGPLVVFWTSEAQRTVAQRWKAADRRRDAVVLEGGRA